jgi:hypothetical protein
VSRRAASELALLAASALAASACRDSRPGGGGDAPPRRSKDAGPPVVVVGEPTAGGVAGGLVVAEVEPNDAPGAPGALVVPGGISGTIGEGDVDRFAFTATADGVLALRVEPSEALDAIVEVVAPGLPPRRSDARPPGGVEGVPDLPIAKGRRYVVTVTRFSKKTKKPKAGGVPAGYAYRLIAELVTPAPEAEREPNDTTDLARGLALGVEATGYLGWAKDVDVWRFAADGVADRALDLSIGGLDGVALSAEVIAGPTTLIARKGKKGEGLELRGLVVATPGTLALRLQGGGSNPTDAYRVRVEQRALGPLDEREPNDLEATATPIALAPGAERGEARGFVDGAAGDVFRFGALEPIALSLELVPPAAADVVLRVGGRGGMELARADGGKRGAAERLGPFEVRPGADLFVEVTGDAPGDLAEPYALRWSWTPGSPPPDPALEPAPTE